MKAIITALLTTAILILPGQLLGQEDTRQGLEQELRDMVVAPTEVDQDRRVVQEFLDRSDVQSAAAVHGIDVEALQNRVATLEAEATSDLAERVRQTQDDLDQVGGDSFVITTSTIVLVLLVLILIAVI